MQTLKYIFACNHIGYIKKDVQKGEIQKRKITKNSEEISKRKVPNQMAKSFHNKVSYIK